MDQRVNVFQIIHLPPMKNYHEYINMKLEKTVCFSFIWDEIFAVDDVLSNMFGMCVHSHICIN